MRTVVLGLTTLLVLWLGQAPAPVMGQDRSPLPKKDEAKPVAKKLVLTVGSIQPLQMSKKWRF